MDTFVQEEAARLVAVLKRVLGPAIEPKAAQELVRGVGVGYAERHQVRLIGLFKQGRTVEDIIEDVRPPDLTPELRARLVEELEQAATDLKTVAVTLGVGERSDDVNARALLAAVLQDLAVLDETLAVRPGK